MNDGTIQPAGRLLAWNEVKDAADNLFKVWFDGSELAWAERAWGMMEKAGLTRHRDAVEETLVLVRLLALASLYWDFCHHGADEEFGWDELYCHATDHLELEPLRLGQLVGPEFDADDYGSSEFSRVEGALHKLIAQERPAIGKVLLAGFGHEGALLDSLFATRQPARDPDDEDDPGEEPPSPDFIPAARVMGWIMEGMPIL